MLVVFFSLADSWVKNLIGRYCAAARSEKVVPRWEQDYHLQPVGKLGLFYEYLEMGKWQFRFTIAPGYKHTPKKIFIQAVLNKSIGRGDMNIFQDKFWWDIIESFASFYYIKHLRLNPIYK